MRREVRRADGPPAGSGAAPRRSSGTPALTRIALLSAAGAALNLLELPLPRPLPFAKPGFANLATLVAAATGGRREALAVALVRPLLAALLSGSFMTPAFALSLAGSVAAWAAMASMLGARFAPLSAAVGGALAHNLAQLAAARALTGAPGLSALIPPLLAAGVAAGLLTGALAGPLLARIGGRRSLPVRRGDSSWRSRPCV